ncbi:DNA topoisomerase-1 [Rhizobium azooxidifex]|uniref:DNA topoisomerase n=1 Tax=Mycoplana azooxidifex TaxID=1636188 RepID=A0A7W6GKP7_9HYPH|nr:DNA topoisomerase IB [Mycoplana azooxidifex]MBB3978890.1 DNA topoisomerase-1 [Mycoplana azooxidifex]
MLDRTLQKIGLTYVSDSEPGIRRERRGRGFCYRLPCGTLLDDPDVKRRIAALGLPPAYRDVWICMLENGHLQATGLDARGRKQYRYHGEWKALRSADKFQQLVPFAMALPKLRRTLRRHLEGSVGSPDTILAGLVTLLDEEHLRVGNSAYAAENRTYGATTLLKRHVRVAEDCIELRFTGKGGKRVRRVLRNPRLHRMLEAVADLPGRQLFVWMGEDGAVRPIDSGRLNAYLAEHMDLAVSAKTFRTWAGSLAAFAEARRMLAAGERPTIRRMSEAAAAILHNTPAICRTSYIHPDVLGLAQRTAPLKAGNGAAAAPKGLRAEESRLLAFLARRPRRKG